MTYAVVLHDSSVRYIIRPHLALSSLGIVGNSGGVGLAEVRPIMKIFLDDEDARPCRIPTYFP